MHDTPTYNGVAERLNHVLLEHTQAFLHSSMLPKFLWGEAVKRAVWLKNRMVTRALLNDKTPYEMLYGKKPNLAGLREWGMKVWVHDASGTKLKADQGLDGGLVSKRRVMLTEYSGQIITLSQWSEILNSTIMTF